MSCGNSVTISTTIVDDADYVLDSVGIFGPTTIALNTTAEYRINFTFTMRNSGGSVSPYVVLSDFDSGLRFGDDLLVKEQYNEFNPGGGTFTRSITMTLRCNGEEGDRKVEGTGASGFGEVGASDEGDWQLTEVNAADVFARVQRGRESPSQFVDSNTIEVECE
jgi:hypothetical protein